MFRFQTDLKVYLHREPVDGDKAINGLALLVVQALGLNPFELAIYVFSNRRRDRVKLVIYPHSPPCSSAISRSCKAFCNCAKPELMSIMRAFRISDQLWQNHDIKVPPCFIVVCNNTSTSKLVYDYISGFVRENEDGSSNVVNGRLSLFRNYYGR